MKKLIAIVIVLLITFMPFTYALSTADKANSLNRLGLFQGTSSSSFVPDLNGSTNREQAIKLIAMSLGWNINASDKSSFKDVSAWAQPYVKRAIDLGITNGVSTTKFDAKGVVTGKQVTTWFLRALSYGMQEAWDNTKELGVTSKLLTGTEYLDGTLIRNDLVNYTWQALSASKNGSTNTLASDLINSGVITQEQANNEGLSTSNEEEEEVVPPIVSEPTTDPIITLEPLPNSTQASVGSLVTFSTKVSKPDTEVVFNIGSSLDNTNSNIEKVVKSDSNGLATLKYTRNKPDVDTVVAYTKANPKMRTNVAKVYWGIKPILSIELLSNKKYTVTACSPFTGKVIPNFPLRVTFKENLKELVANTMIYTDTSPKQSVYKDVTLSLTTDSIGKATFTLSGNDSVTPIIFYDYNTFLDKEDYMEYAGNNNNKFDSKELMLELPSVVPEGASNVTITSDVLDDSTYPISVGFKAGKKYTITVKDSPNAIVNVSLKELQSNTTNRSRFIGASTGKVENVIGSWVGTNIPSNTILQSTVTDSVGVRKFAINLDKDGTATFVVSCDTDKAVATPVVWIDKEDINMYGGKANGLLDKVDLSTELPKVTFGAGNVTNARMKLVESTNIAYELLDDSKNVLFNAEVGSKVTFTIVNTGKGTINANSTTLSDVFANGIKTNGNVPIDAGKTVTISANVIQASEVILSLNGSKEDSCTVYSDINRPTAPKYFECPALKVVFNVNAGAILVQKAVGSEFKGTLKEDVKSSLGTIQVNLPNDRYFTVNLNEALNSSTAIYLNEALATNDLSEPLYNRYQKLFMALTKGSNVSIKFSAINPDVVESILVQYTNEDLKLKDIYVQAIPLNRTALNLAKTSVPDLATFTTVSALAVTNALALPEVTQVQIDNKVLAINNAVRALALTSLIKTFEVFPGISIGSLTVLITLNVPDPSLYDVLADTIPLRYDTETKSFIKEVKAEYAVQTAITVRRK